ncbi:diguanylate cyclase [Nannocystis sp. ILAH1]|uniref:sensor domain-containing diguanylate cyclase n=1 Tax=unclassified Nannocystis TaxID=2627009 RepID=UPI0022709639|nr:MULTISPECIES: diguanylate cyclase [unclassified Nannocystis]MCY0991556.1 diguanylate cyclase [Nannocystis sp. ILAH1]MCY1066604.1 diguanylate cyclase [Nannocystis sp. RBIL2]
MTTLARTLHGLRLRARERWSLLVLLATWLVLAVGAATPTAFDEGSPALAASLMVFAATLVRALARELRPNAATYSQTHELELGLLIITGTYLLIAVTGGLASPAHPLVYALASFLLLLHRARWIAGVWLASIALLEVAVGWSSGHDSGARIAFHLSYIAFFAAGNLLILGALVRRLRGEHAQRLADELTHIRQEARDFRLVAAAAPRKSRDAEEAQLTQSAVHAIHEQVAFSLELIRGDLELHTCALLWMSEEELVLKRAASASTALVGAPELANPGVLAGLLRNPRTLVLKNMSEKHLPPYYGAPVAVTDLCAVPLVRGERLLGILCADRVDAMPFTAAEQDKLTAAAQHVLRTVDHERAFITAMRSRYEHEQLYRASELLSGALGLEALYGKSFEAIRAIAPYDLAAISTYDEHAEAHRVLAVDVPGDRDPNHGAGWRSIAESLRDRVFEHGSGLVAMATKNRHFMPAADERVEPETVVFDVHTRLRPAQSVLVLPLLHGEKVLGTLTLAAARERQFPRATREILRVLSHQLSVGLQNARMYRAMEERATTDGLTGLTNHRAFQERLAQIHALAERTGRNFSLILTDIDHFKKVNDTYGHPIGDAVLKRVAAVFAGRARKVDIVARYGGEEFVLVLPDTDAEGAAIFANKLREEVAAQTMTSDHGPFAVTISMGVAEYPTDGHATAELIERADQALYHCKHNGRNCVTRASQLP